MASVPSPPHVPRSYSSCHVLGYEGLTLEKTPYIKCTAHIWDMSVGQLLTARLSPEASMWILGPLRSPYTLFGAEDLWEMFFVRPLEESKRCLSSEGSHVRTLFKGIDVKFYQMPYGTHWCDQAVSSTLLRNDFCEKISRCWIPLVFLD